MFPKDYPTGLVDVENLCALLVKQETLEQTKVGVTLALFEIVNWRIKEHHLDEWDRALRAVLDQLEMGDVKARVRCQTAVRQLCRPNNFTEVHSLDDDASLITRILNGQYFQEFAPPDTQEGIV